MWNGWGREIDIFYFMRSSFGSETAKAEKCIFYISWNSFNEIQIRYKLQNNRHKGSKNPNFVQQSGYFLKEKLVRNDSAEFFEIFFQ